MQVKIIWALLVCVLLIPPVCAQEEQAMDSPSNARRPVVSGAFYPGSKERLASQVSNFIKNAILPDLPKDKRLLAIIVPHAGYDYSGGVAGYAFKLLEGKPMSSAILIGPSHYVGFEGISIYPKGKWQTPLGELAIDEKLAEAFMSETDKIYFYPAGHAREHCLEVELPFLQIAGSDNLKIVPMVMGEQSLEDAKVLSRVLANVLKEREDVLLVISVDLSHYHPYDEAVKLDRRAISDIERLDIDHFIEGLNNGDIEIDAPGVVIATIETAKQLGATKAHLIKYANSGDVTGDKSKVVGYAAMAIFVEKQSTSTPVTRAPEEKSGLNKAQQKQLLKLARDTIENYIRNNKKIEFRTSDPQLIQNSGVFVTLNKSGHLRGCIGFIHPLMPLYQGVQEAAISSATQDFRFVPVKESELKDIDIEISVLSPLKKIESIDEIEVGKHGIYIEKGFNSGLLLPQVATEYEWDRQTFLEETCRKAGLPSSAYKEKSSRISIFSAQIFGEEQQ